MDRRESGYGYDADPARRPGIPLEPEAAPDASWREPTPQRDREEHLTRAGREELTPVLGNAAPPKMASGALRRAAYRIPEHEAKRWLLLMAAERLDTFEDRLPDLLQGEGLEAVKREVRNHPLESIAVGVGLGYVLGRSGVLGGLAGGLLAAAMSQAQS